MTREPPPPVSPDRPEISYPWTRSKRLILLFLYAFFQLAPRLPVAVSAALRDSFRQEIAETGPVHGGTGIPKGVKPFRTLTYPVSPSGEATEGSSVPVGRGDASPACRRTRSAKAAGAIALPQWNP